ncbi:putative transmembrane protease serine 9-like protein, partial [Operophtera brumata]
TQPRVASLRNATTDLHLCGATLLSSEFALTAAHCVEHSADQYVLYLNNYCIKHEEVPRIEVSQVIVNELYDKSTRAHDIALLRISHDFDDTAWLNRTVLPKSSLGLSGECTIFGYGYKHPDVKETSEMLFAGPMSIVSLDECLQILGPYVAPAPDGGMMCAMGAGVDACQQLRHELRSPRAARSVHQRRRTPAMDK